MFTRSHVFLSFKTIFFLVSVILNLFFDSLAIAQDSETFEVVSIDSFIRPRQRLLGDYSKIPEQSRNDLIELGRFLFYDPRLSRSSMMSCATCHNPSFYWTDSLKVSIEKGTRRSMSLLNIGSDKLFSWQGRAGSISAMTRLPLIAPNGMNSDQEVIDSHIFSITSYRDLFKKTYEPISQIKPIPINFFTIGSALELYVSTIVSPISRFDRFVKGEKNLFSTIEQKGFDLFRGKAGCAQCHSGWKLSDGELYDIGLKIDPKDGDLFQGGTAFKAVGLRAIALRPPYMHNGSIANIEEVVEFYNRGGEELRPTLSKKIKQLNLTEEEKKQLVAFLFALDEDPLKVEFPRLPR